MTSTGGESIRQECRAKKRMDKYVYVSGAGELQNNGVECIVHVRSPKSGPDCEKVSEKRSSKSVKYMYYVHCSV